MTSHRSGAQMEVTSASTSESPRQIDEPARGVGTHRPYGRQERPRAGSRVDLDDHRGSRQAALQLVARSQAPRIIGRNADDHPDEQVGGEGRREGPKSLEDVGHREQQLGMQGAADRQLSEIRSFRVEQLGVIGVERAVVLVGEEDHGEGHVRPTESRIAVPLVRLRRQRAKCGGQGLLDAASLGASRAAAGIRDEAIERVGGRRADPGRGRPGTLRRSRSHPVPVC